MYVVQPVTFIVMSERESQVHLGIQHGTFVHIPQCEILDQCRVQRMGRTPTVSPRREARDTSFMWDRMSATRYQLIGVREIGPAKSCSKSLSRSGPVTMFFLFCGAPSSLPPRSRRLTISNAFAVLQAMEVQEILPIGSTSEERSAVMPSSC